MRSLRERCVPESAFPHRHKPTSGISCRYLPIIHFLVVLCITSAGCITTGPAVPTAPGIGSAGPDFSGIFIYQNIVNTSQSGEALMNSSGSAPEVRRSAAIRDALDSHDPVTRDFAVSLIPQAHGGSFNLAQICDLWETVYSRWTYVDDPSGDDYFSPASRTIALGFKGDCDDFAIVVAAMIESIGGSARIVTAQNGTYGHAYPEVYVGDTLEEFEAAAAYIRKRYHVTDVGCHITTGEDGPRYWLNLDWWSSHPGGKFYADEGVRTAYYPDGRWEQVEATVR